jgi:outer membrane protein OmpA-like peptidoglycan-associated protein
MVRSIPGIALICLIALSGTQSARAQAKDVAGSSDHPAVGRYEGAVITFHETKAYEEISLPYKGLDRGEKDNRPAWQADLAGKLTSIRYEGPGDRSALEVMRNYEAALKAKGFTIRFFCRDQKECSPGRAISTFWNAGKGKIGMPTTWDTTAYMLAERDNAEGRVTVGLLGVETKARAGKPLTPHVAVTIVESKPMESGKITVVEAKEMERALARDGRIAIYGITFDFDKAIIKPESRPQIDQLGVLLKDNPKLEVLIVGHTDGKGAFDYNLSLSQRRAQAVSEALVSGHGIAAARLTPAGAGMVSPVASNRTEEGRARNRRVEIVERYTGG